MDVYSIDSAIEIIKQKTGQSCDPIMLASMFMSKKINVCLVYDGYVCEVGDDILLSNKCFGNVLGNKLASGYVQLSADNDIASLINGKTSSLYRDYVRSRKGIVTYLYGDEQFHPDNLPKDSEDLKLNDSQPSPINITRHELVFTIASINSYITSIVGVSLEAKYAELEKEHEKLKADSKKLNEDLAELSLKKTIKKTGVSQAKVDAKLAAATLADYLWRKDTDQRIKIKDMATTVLIELKQTSHIDQLPENPESLKKWIEEIAPPYAREAGRPTEK